MLHRMHRSDGSIFLTSCIESCSGEIGTADGFGGGVCDFEFTDVTHTVAVFGLLSAIREGD